MTPSRDIGRLIEIMAALRTPKTGCPWDLAQDFTTIAPYTIEEAYEVADAIARHDMADLKEELGDLLLGHRLLHQRARAAAGAAPHLHEHPLALALRRLARVGDRAVPGDRAAEMRVARHPTKSRKLAR